MKHLFSFVLLWLLTASLTSAQHTVMYRLFLKDKKENPYSTEHPEAYLSKKSIDRRSKQGYVVDDTDLPITPYYIDAIKETGAEIRATSKWLNTVVVRFSDETVLEELMKLDFVDSSQCVWRENSKARQLSLSFPVNLQPLSEYNTYGYGRAQVTMNNTHLLHDAGYQGTGISIAVLDGGFINIDSIRFFDQQRIKEVKNFTHETTDLYREGADHGTKVLSCMLANVPGDLVGTAPQADYYLFRTEVVSDEYPVEEDYWVAALEYADSLGIDIVTTSLGYTSFDDTTMNHSHAQLDGQTVPASRAASMAYKKGLILTNSAGNEGNKAWRTISVPSDASHALSIGSVTADSIRSSFSSYGITIDGRVKPDIMGMGSSCSVVGENGFITYASGTSYSNPVLAGAIACLWEALPMLTNLEIMAILKRTASHSDLPDSEMGYGIADVYKAYRWGLNYLSAYDWLAKTSLQP